jgi:hypothetical protein
MNQTGIMAMDPIVKDVIVPETVATRPIMMVMNLMQGIESLP